MKFYVLHYQHKSEPYRRALLDAGHVEDKHNPDVLLVDRDKSMMDGGALRPSVKKYDGMMMMYPHDCLGLWNYDGINVMDERVKAAFVFADAQYNASAIYIPARVELIRTGWAWCEQREFTRPAAVKKILFMPSHADSTGNLRPEARETNTAIMMDLLRLKSINPHLDITVRYINSMRSAGVFPTDAIAYREGMFNGATDDIDSADVVIAEGTALYMSVARGRPTIGFNQHLPPRSNVGLHTPKTWNVWRSQLEYPINYGTKPLENLMDDAMHEQSDWRARNIGRQFCGAEFAAHVERVYRACA